MLVLSRKNGETIEIDGGITVQVLRIEGNRVRIGISAPKGVNILRGELPSRQEFSEEITLNLAPEVEHKPFAAIAATQVSLPC